MDWRTVFETIGFILDIKLFDIGGTPLDVGTLLTGLAIMALTFRASRLFERAAERFLTSRGIQDPGTLGATKRLFHYSTLLVGFGVAIHTVGINLSTLFAAGAVFAVAIGFAMQNITSNFVSGVILLGERAIKPGDVLEVEGEMVRVRDMGIRATTVRTLDDEDMIIPNSLLVQSTVTNYTLRDSLTRLRIVVGVAYSSDLRRVREVLERCATELEARAPARDPVVLLDSFGSSSVDFEVSIWIEDPWRSRPLKSSLREAVWWGLREAGITIAFPQLDVHFDEPMLHAIEGAQRIA